MISRNSFSYLSPRRQSSYASISGSGSFDDLGSTSSSSGIGGIASRFATLRATRRKDGRDALSVKDVLTLSRDSRRHMIAVCVLTSLSGVLHDLLDAVLTTFTATRCCRGICSVIGIRARGAGGRDCSLPDSGKTIIFQAKAKFFGQKPAAKNENKILFVFIKRIHSV